MKVIFRKKKRHFLLLEILIALAIMAICIIPLLAPQADIIKQQKKFIQTMSLDHAVNLLYVQLLDELQQNEVDWKGIEGHAQFPITADMLNKSGFVGALPFTGTYRFDEAVFPSGRKAVKSNEKTGLSIYKFVVTFVFTSNRNDNKVEKFIFPYELCMMRTTHPTAETEATEATNEKS